MPLAQPPLVTASREDGYRMRARLHAHNGRLGFYREGSHDVCGAAGTGQLLSSTNAWIERAEAIIEREARAQLIAIEIAENIAGDERACHLELHEGADASRYAPLADGLVGLSARYADHAETVMLSGTPVIHDLVEVRHGDARTLLRLRRHVRAFFQGNRYLITTLVHEVVADVPRGPVIDLYAGGGLLGLSLAATRSEPVTLVEGDAISGADLELNAAAFQGQVRVERRSVEAFLANIRAGAASTIVLDPPRTGLSKDALAGVGRARPRSIVYVSCDVPTLARDARGLLDAGYSLNRLAALDLFPNTAHVEVVGVFSRT
jgi:tRNA/tmRNA/rRNA uracil-C5-methylase (TrmA/RlmC/RlmD family)